MVYEQRQLIQIVDAAMNEITSVYQLLIDTGVACGETAGILDIAYLRRAHQRRQRIVEAAGSAALDGRPATPERLYAWLGEVPIEAQANLGAESYAAEIFAALNSAASDHPLAQAAAELATKVRARVGRDVLAGAAGLLAGRDSITPESRVALAQFLRGILGTAEPALSPSLGGAEAAAKRGATAFDRYMAERLEKASRRALSSARTLRAGLAAANTVLQKHRSSSHVREIAELLFAGHPLTISSASRIFHISRLAARKHLVRLTDAGLAEPASRRRNGVVYLARDGLMTFNAAGTQPSPRRASARLVVSAGSPLSSDERARLELVSDDVAERVRDLDRLLQRLAVGRSS
jgi:DNA-binding transcriptional ArsR family regulator